VIPVLETERLRLRGHRLDDFEACVALWADPAVTRYIGGKPSTRELTWARLLRYAGHWSMLGFGYWVVEEKASGDFAGEVGFADFKRDIDPPIDVAELGWVLVPRMHGKGYGTEAVRAALEWGDRHFGSTRTVCLIAPENAPSIRVAEKCGYREILRTAYKDEPTLLFERG
jgi:RimJ/RimL family protein N-acetyltransferase